MDVSPISAKDRDDILLQIIDDLDTSSRGRQHQYVVAELAERIARHDLPAKPQPWLASVTAEAIMGDACVVTATTGLVCDVPSPSTDRSGKTVT